MNAAQVGDGFEFLVHGCKQSDQETKMLYTWKAPSDEKVRSWRHILATTTTTAASVSASAWRTETGVIVLK